jgi:hypothetical protein
LARRFQRGALGEALIARLQQLDAEREVHRQQNFVGAMLRHHQHKSTQYMSQWIAAKNRVTRP